MKKYKYSITKVEQFTASKGQGDSYRYLRFYFAVTVNGKKRKAKTEHQFFTVEEDLSTNENINEAFSKRIAIDLHNEEGYRQEQEQARFAKKQERELKKERDSWVGHTIYISNPKEFIVLNRLK